MNGNGRANLTLAAVAAAAFTPFAEKQWHITPTADDVLNVLAGAALIWHAVASALGPYAKRVFDHYFPPQPATEPAANPTPPSH